MNKIIISNGHSKFHLSVAAVEIDKSNMLSKFITAAYPHPFISDLIIKNNFFKGSKLMRLANRSEKINYNLISSLWISELFFQIGILLKKIINIKFLSENLIVFSMGLYGYQSRKILKKVEAGIYHYRSGYGGSSLKIAKSKDMILLADHSIANPQILEDLVGNLGKFRPNFFMGKISLFWRHILTDLRKADYILVNSDFVKKTFTSFTSTFNTNNIHVIYCGVDDQFLNYIPRKKFKLKKNNINNIKIIFAGNFEKRKGAEILIAAIKKLKTPGKEWTFEIIGGIDPELKENHSNFFSLKNLRCSGLVSRNELAHKMFNADIFVFPSLAEGSARVIFEAMACGCFIITTPNSGSIVKDDINGLVVETGNINQLKEALKKSILLSSAKRQKIGKLNYDLIRREYTQFHYGKNLKKLYSLLLKQKRDIL